MLACIKSVAMLHRARDRGGVILLIALYGDVLGCFRLAFGVYCELWGYC